MKLIASHSARPGPACFVAAWTIKSLVGLALAAAAPALADIRGMVLDVATRKPIANAVIRNVFGTQSTVSDAQGRFLLAIGTALRPRPGRAPGGKTPRVLAPGSRPREDAVIFDSGGRLRAGGEKLAVPGLLPAAAASPEPGSGRARSKTAALPCLLALEAAAYKPREANCTENGNDTVALVPETAARYYYQVPVDAGDGWALGHLADLLPRQQSVLGVMDSLAAKRYKEVHSLLLIKGGRLILEEYYQGSADTIDFTGGIKRVPLGNVQWNRTGKHYVASVNKSITSALVGLALAKSARPVTTPLVQLLPKYQAQFTGNKAAITVADALTMTMGFQWDEWAGRDLIDMWATQDVGAYVLAKPMAAAPGAEWTYNSAGPNLLLAAMETAVGGDMVQFARDALFAPLGIEDFRWGRQPNGLPEASARMFMRPRDMAKLGQLYLKGGAWQGRQVVPADWVAQSTKLQKSALPKNPNGYGYLWWIRKLTTPKGTPIDYYQADGDGGQYIVVFPAQDMVVVATGGNYGDYGTYEAQMVRILAQHVLPALNL